MSEQYVGKLKKQTSKNGKEYFKGMFGKVPVVAFWGRKDPDQINIKLDVGLIKWIDEQEDTPRSALNAQGGSTYSQAPPTPSDGDSGLPF